MILIVLHIVESRSLPSEIQFHLDDEFDVDVLSNNISFETDVLNYNNMNDTELAEVVNVVEEILCETVDDSKVTNFPEEKNEKFVDLV